VLKDRMTDAYTFDDVLLLPGESNVLPHEVGTRTWFSRHIPLNIPLVSAAMDTVTEAQTAIVMARHGGIGVVHRNMSAAEQAAQIRRVKKAEANVIEHPVTLPTSAAVAQVHATMAEHGISGIPIVDGGGKLAGIVTNRDLRFVTAQQKPVTEIMTKDNLITVPPGISTEQAKTILQKHRIEKLLVVNDEGALVGLITIKDILQREEHPNANLDERGHLRVAAAVGTDAHTDERITALLEAGADAIVVDTAHGHSQRVVDTVKRIRKQWPNAEIVAGNIATEAAAKALIAADIDGLKVGIGPGSICTTRIVAGIGVPQLTAIDNVAAAARAAGVPVVADGGIKFSGDLVKALAVGAHATMIGSLFAGTDESPGERILYQGRSYKVYRGMGSLGAMVEGSRDRYFQDSIDELDLDRKLVPEGIEGRVPYRGKLADTLYQLVGGLRGGMGYVGAADIQDLYEKAQFVRISNAGYRESHVHDVIITREAPNYRIG